MAENRVFAQLKALERGARSYEAPRHRDPLAPSNHHGRYEEIGPTPKDFMSLHESFDDPPAVKHSRGKYVEHPRLLH